ITINLNLKQLKSVLLFVLIMKLKEFLKKNKLSEGKFISFEFNKNKIFGTIIPSIDDNLMIKLDSGYNAGFNVSEIKNIEIIKENKKVGKASKIEIKKDPNLPTISLLHTGGTIASRVNYSTGGVYASFDG